MSDDSLDEPTQAVPAAAVVGGRYRLDVLVGRGGTAEVWQATDTQLRRVVALKLVTAPHDESAVRAADEARTLAQFAHPALVQVYDAGTDNSGRPWVVMEFVEGATLADAMRARPIPVHRVAEIGATVADGLAHVHSRGLVHRDIKPANVLLGSDGTVKLTDFGIARLIDAARVTSTGLMVGTASYLAPEQVAGEPVGPAVDVYALGLLLLEALTGVREYDGPPVEAAMARLHRDPALPETLPAGWADLLAAMTAREAVDRPTAAQVAQALRAFAGGATTTVIAAPAPRTQALRATSPATSAATSSAGAPRRTGLWVALAAVGVLLAGGVGVAVSQGQSDTPATIRPVSADLPEKLRTSLQQLADQVAPR